MGIQKVATAVNKAFYDLKDSDYIDGAPHIKHKSLQNYYCEKILQAYNTLKSNEQVNVLDLGAGEGSVTLPFLTLGCRVCAVDVSEKQLASLRAKCSDQSEALVTHQQDVLEFLNNLECKKFDIIVLNSFLHHVPDYVDLLAKCSNVLSSEGVIFTFQDPLKYSSLSKLSRLYSWVVYYLWRIKKGDLIGGLKRFVRRSRGVYLADCAEDNVEYHVVRDGVDHESIHCFLQDKGFSVDLDKYFTTQLGLFQKIGELLGFKSHFSIVAKSFDQY